MESAVNSAPKYELEGSLWLNTLDLDWSCVTDGLKPRAYLPQEELFHQVQEFEYVYLCKSGRIQLDARGKNGNRRILFICDSNTLFGELSLFDTMPYNCTAVSVTHSLVYLIPSEVFMEKLALYPKLATNVMKTQSMKLRLLTTIIKQLTFYDASYRVAYTLVNLVNDYSRQLQSKTYKLTLKYTHQDLADLTGLSRVSVSNIVSRFQSMGILKKDPADGYVVIKDPKKLYDFLLNYD